MAIHIPRGESDPVLERIIETLHAYDTDHPDSRIDLYRQNPASVRVRIIDPSFTGMTRVAPSSVASRMIPSIFSPLAAACTSVTGREGRTEAGRSAPTRATALARATSTISASASTAFSGSNATKLPPAPRRCTRARGPS